MAMQSIRAAIGTAITYNTASGTGSPIAFSGTLAHEPTIIWFRNRSNVPVTLTQVGGGTITFDAGEKWVVDLNTNRSDVAPIFTFAKGTAFTGTSAAGTGLFEINYFYATP